MNDGASHDPTSAMSDGRNNPEPQTEEERIFFNEVLDEQLEAAASSPIVTFTLSLVLFACQFCPSDRASSECPLCTEFAFGRAWSEAIDQRGNSQRDQKRSERWPQNTQGWAWHSSLTSRRPPENNRTRSLYPRALIVSLIYLNNSPERRGDLGR